jgi:hypothetical protein
MHLISMSSPKCFSQFQTVFHQFHSYHRITWLRRLRLYLMGYRRRPTCRCTNLVRIINCMMQLHNLVESHLWSIDFVVIAKRKGLRNEWWSVIISFFKKESVVYRYTCSIGFFSKQTVMHHPRMLTRSSSTCCIPTPLSMRGPLIENMSGSDLYECRCGRIWWRIPRRQREGKVGQQHGCQCWNANPELCRHLKANSLYLLMFKCYGYE